MRKLVLFFFLATICLVCVAAIPLPNPDEPYEQGSLLSVIKKNIATLGRGTRTGIAVRNLTTGKYLVLVNAQERFIPASTTKLFTSNAALTAWGENFDFITAAQYPSGALHSDTIIGNIYITGNSDPELSSSTVVSLADAVARAGIHYITGNIIITPTGKSTRQNVPKDSLLIVSPDSTADDTPPEENISPEEDKDEYEKDTNIHGFVSSGSEFALDRNTLTVTITAGDRKGERVNVNTSLPGVEIVSHAITAAPAKVITRRIRLRSLRHGKPRYQIKKIYRSNAKLTLRTEFVHGKQLIVIRGALPAHSHKRIVLPLPSLSTVVASVFLDALRERGIQVTGTTARAETLPRNMITVAEHRYSLADLLATMNKESDNYLAESLFRRIEVNRARGAEATKRAALAKKILAENFFVCDGCGLARENRVTPQALVDLLSEMYYDKAAFRVFFPSLSVAGVDGTLHKRLRDMNASGHVFAKSGTLSGVRALAGYIVTAHADTLAFAFMHEGIRSSQRVRSMQDAICEALFLADLTLQDSIHN